MRYPTPVHHDIQGYFELSDSQVTAFCSIPYLASLLPPLICRFVLKFRSEKALMRGTATLGLVSWIILRNANPEDQNLVFVHQILAGISLGAISLVIPSFMSKFMAEDAKPLTDFIHQIAIGCGFLIVNLAGLWLDWCQLTILGAALFRLFLMSLGFIPDIIYYIIKTSHNGTELAQIERHFDCRRMAFCLLLIGIRKISGLDVVFANLNWFRVGGIAAVTASAGVLIGAMAMLKNPVRDERKIMSCLSLCAGSLAFGLFCWNLKGDRRPMMASGSLAFFLMLAAFGFRQIAQKVQWEYFHECRVTQTTRSCFFALENLLSFVLIYFYPNMADRYGERKIMPFCAVAMLIGAAYGWYVFRPGQDLGDEQLVCEGSPLLGHNSGAKIENCMNS